MKYVIYTGRNERCEVSRLPGGAVLIELEKDTDTGTHEEYIEVSEAMLPDFITALTALQKNGQEIHLDRPGARRGHSNPGVEGQA